MADNLLQVRRGNEGVIQVSQQAYNDVYKGAGFNVVQPTITPAPTTQNIAVPNQSTSLQSNILPNNNVQTGALPAQTQAESTLWNRYNLQQRNPQSQAPAATQAQAITPIPGQIPFKSGLNTAQQSGITNLVNSGRAFNETDAKNYAYATGASDYKQFVGKTGAQLGLLTSTPQFAATAPTTTGTVDSSVLQAPPNLKLPDLTQGTDINAFLGSLDSLNQLTQSDNQKSLEKDRTTLESHLGDLNTQLQGRDAYNTQLESQYDVAGNTSKLKEINAQIAQKIGEYQKANLDIEGKPIPLGLLRGQQAMLQQQQAVDVGVLQGQAEALKGNLELSYNLIDRAMAMKFDPIQQQIDNTMNFLQLNSQDLSREEQKQAQKIEAVMQLRQQALDAAKEVQSRNRDLMLAVAQNGGDPRLVDFSKSFEENLINAAPYLKAASDLDQPLSIDEAQKLGVPYGTTKREAFGRTVSNSDGGLGGLSKEQLSERNNIISQVNQDKDVTTFIPVRDAYNQILNGANGKSAAGDISIISGYMKLLDPTSSVREGEYATASNAGSIPESIRALYNKSVDGTPLADNLRQDFVNKAAGLYQNKLEAYNRAIDLYGRAADAFGIPRDLVLRDFVGAKTVDQQISELQSRGIDTGTIINQVKQADPKFDQYYQAKKDAGFDDTSIINDYKQARAGQTFEGAGVTASAVSPSTPDITNLGSLSAKYESGGSPSSIGKDSTGGWSYGAYQLTQKNVDNFIKFLEFTPLNGPLVQTLKAARVGSSTFNEAWKKLGEQNAQQFGDVQTQYIGDTYFKNAQTRLSQDGVDITQYSDAFKQVVWSTAVQHGPASAAKIIKRAIDKGGTEQDIINRIYDFRWNDGKNFKSSTKEVASAVHNRLQNERKDALALLNPLA